MTSLTIDFLNPAHLLALSLSIAALFALIAMCEDGNSPACFVAFMLGFATVITFIGSLFWLIAISL